MGFPSTRHLYPSDPARRRLQLANEAAKRASVEPVREIATGSGVCLGVNIPPKTYLDRPFTAAPVKNAELVANAICKAGAQAVSELQKRIVLSRFWVGDFVFHRIHGERGLITSVQFISDRMVPRYYCVFNTNADGWTEEMELSLEPVYPEAGNPAKA